MNNRLNSHDAWLARVEIGKPDVGKSSGEDDTCGSGDVHRNARDDHCDNRDEHDGGDFDRDHAWVEFRDRAIRDRE
jgi:hypothetical protein